MTKVVIDTDAINFLLSTREGRLILHHVVLVLPASIVDELNPRERGMLADYTVELHELDEDDKEWAARMIFKINQDKQQKKRYLAGELRRVRNVGECEGAALSRKHGIDIVLLDQTARSILRKAFQFHQVRCIFLPDFGRRVLEEHGTPADVSAFKATLKQRLRIS